MENYNLGTYNDISSLYESLIDEESKLIFKQRLMYSLTGDHSYISDMVYHLYSNYYSKSDGLFWDSLKHFPLKKDGDSQKKVVLFGAGINGRILYEFLTKCGYVVDCFCDNNSEKHGIQYCGLRVISRKELVDNYSDSFIVISIQNNTQEVITQLLNEGISSDNIINGCPVFGHQYFIHDLIKSSANEIFIDAGCYDGDSSLDFINWCNGDFNNIYAFEPDSNNFEVCQKVFENKGIKNIQLINCGLWSKNETLCFTNTGGGDSRVNNSSTYQIKAVSLDDVLNVEKVTFIKMDIEGAELEALKGARQTIQLYKPKLAISLYHKPEDILDIPLYIKQLVPEYKFYIRHHTLFQVETVLYAI